MLKKLFGGKKSVEEQMVAPLDGKIVSLDEVDDPVFSQRMMGDGVAIEPTGGKVVSPVAGEIVQLFPTNHAVGIKTKSGVEVLVHIGLETVSLEGEGFEGHITTGDKVNAGDHLITFDMDLVREKAKSTITPVVITNYDDSVEQFHPSYMDGAHAGESTIITVKTK
ncbi:PTS sugar transporter subunit IIA [Halobacillus karajensis]|uniref:Glucose-specific phosphotransferase enzyme IIA component n=1 Tax=Halobacillus karajensis TaxID=195088 RepID=A0A024P5G5_9BACI|nr:PTS glucose transporter subunit IIA [Halobacillus karajensis]CDQ18716.1 Glucose-specific phosphotransferase enzyme IIA component [Halobacillus karajensis]CDQ23212.1 Glucose-specific phosphotransferase enzyme IIA component [Halobacillus karajensis]CDQ26694.1 Glucose-specific phosphotransferase enzyme IIA component [Halobacillus karajensis]